MKPKSPKKSRCSIRNKTHYPFETQKGTYRIVFSVKDDPVYVEEFLEEVPQKIFKVSIKTLFHYPPTIVMEAVGFNYIKRSFEYNHLVERILWYESILLYELYSLP